MALLLLFSTEGPEGVGSLDRDIWPWGHPAIWKPKHGNPTPTWDTSTRATQKARVSGTPVWDAKGYPGTGQGGFVTLSRFLGEIG